MLLGKYYFVYLQQLLGEILRLFISKLIFETLPRHMLVFAGLRNESSVAMVES